MSFFNEVNPMDGSSRSYYLKKAYLPYDKRILMNQTTRNTRVENQTLLVKSGYGEQSNGFLQSVDPEQCAILFSLIPGSTNPSLPTSRESLQLFIHKAITSTTIKNASENACEVTIRQIESRHGVSKGMPWSNPVKAWKLGLHEQLINNLPDGATEGLVGTTPYISNIFNKTYDVKQETRFELSPNKTHIHVAESYINKVLYSELLKFNDRSLRGVTEYQLITTKGTPVINKEKLPIELVSTAKTKLIVTSTTKIDYFWTNDFSHSYTYIDRLPKNLPNQKNEGYNEQKQSVYF